jgi:hypothetical protein
VSDLEGDLIQIDFRSDGTISALHVEGRDGDFVVRIDLPAEPMEPLRPGQVRYMPPLSSRPTVRIERP